MTYPVREVTAPEGLVVRGARLRAPTAHTLAHAVSVGDYLYLRYRRERDDT